MAELTHLPPGAPLPERRHLLVIPRPRLNGFELRFGPGAVRGTADPVREIVRGGLGDAIRLAQDWAYRCDLDTIIVVGAPADHN